MNFTNLISALIVISIFLFGFSQIMLPAYNLWENSISGYRTTKAIHFLSESFKNECEKSNRNMENWSRSISSVKELDSYIISELWKEEELWALKAIFVISGEQIEVLGSIKP